MHQFFLTFFFRRKGVPQGRILSVTLFSLKINGTLNQLYVTVSGSLYIDDWQISRQEKDTRFIEHQLQTAINRIISWTNNNGFNFSTDKTSSVHFCRMNHRQISAVDASRFLGIMFDKKLTFIPHIPDLRKNATKHSIF